MAFCGKVINNFVINLPAMLAVDINIFVTNMFTKKLHIILQTVCHKVFMLFLPQNFHSVFQKFGVIL